MAGVPPVSSDFSQVATTQPSTALTFTPPPAPTVPAPGGYTTNGLGTEYGNVFHSVTGGLTDVWQHFVAPTGRALMDGVHHPAGNGIFQGLAAIFVAMLAWKGMGMLAATRPTFAGRMAVGAAGLALVPALAMGGAALVGTMRHDPVQPTTAPISAPATQDPRLSAPMGAPAAPTR